MTEQEREQWDARMDSYRRRLSMIAIPTDISPGLAKNILSQLDELYTDVRMIFGDILKQNKEVERLIYRIENKNKTGGNEGERRKKMIESVENAMIGTERIDLYEIASEVEGKKEDLSAILDVIDKKNSMIITMNGLLKVESNFA